MAPAFTQRFIQNIPEGISLKNAKCVFAEGKIFLFILVDPLPEVPVFTFDIDIKKWFFVDINNQALLISDSNKNEGDDFDVNTKVETKFGLQLKRDFGNGSSQRYKLDLGNLLWQHVPATPKQRAVYAEVKTSDAQYTIVFQSLSQLELEVSSGNKTIHHCSLENSQLKHNSLKMVDVGNKVYIVKNDYLNKKKEVYFVESGNLNLVNSEAHTRSRMKSVVWSKGVNIFQFTYNRQLVLDCFDTKINSWKKIDLGTRTHIKDVLNFFYHDGKILIVFRSVEKNSIGIAFLELMPNLQTKTLIYFSRKRIEDKSTTDQLMCLLPQNIHVSFDNIYLMYLDQHLAEQRERLQDLQKARRLRK